METYDYIVVGAGSAGCAVAGRLSEDPANRVLLIEAGGSADHFWVNSPAGMGKLFLEKRLNWSYFTEAGSRIEGRSIYWPRGRMLGGTSSVNGMVYMRGHPRDFDHWESLGNPGWGWNDVLPYFRKSESNTRGASDIHGGDGPLRVSDPIMRSPVIDDYLSAAAGIGIPRINDLNAPPYEGADYHQHTIRDGRRESSYTAFIAPVLNSRRNLTLLTKAQVLRVVIEGNAATGIEVQQDGRRRVISAAREIVLSAGSLNSPQLLMLSGVGDGAKLQAAGIETRAHLPGVGQNLQDHWFAPMIWEVTPGSSYNSRVSGLAKYIEGMKYLLLRKGVLAMSASASAVFLRSSDDLQQPDLQMVLRPLSYTFHPKGAVIVDSFPGVSAGVVLLNPGSRGWVDLASADPLAAPLFQPNYLSDPDDARRTLIGIRKMRRIMGSAPVAARVVNERMPGAAAQSDEDLLHHLKTVGNCGWHQVGTCKMGRDGMAVVDARLRVHGVDRLRVADGAIMPTITAGNTNAPCIMIGEKAADMIRQDAAPRR
ncbi:GMC family oxidoreductase [Ruixingdingia sedimenti]|uniref:GMC family oxidoreductase N-terminal domain-containing protein n=1 Tax=Ruixingdingia sedimenti TaxID=3073604 RepID=A0ABU1F5L1_9RHOB|nr:GMC family oxidoreductase N-terminal domain-containing protein [Xinfangfangia sp. LG-4]MDR5652146.1 GMC family oxidoreductase N-terminal domain-containing protein [Xinfangfangia sp. LG-4]